jgi:hypothetical protein
MSDDTLRIFDEINDGIIFLDEIDELTNDTLMDYLDEYRDKIHARIVDCAEYTLNLGIDTVPILFIGTSYSVHFDYSNFEHTISKTIEYYESIEDYETCAHVADLQQRKKSMDESL